MQGAVPESRREERRVPRVKGFKRHRVGDAKLGGTTEASVPYQDGGFFYGKDDRKMKWTGLNDLRETFLAFYESKGHLRLPSFSLDAAERTNPCC